MSDVWQTPYYGVQRNKKFTDIYNSWNDFKAAADEIEIKPDMKEDDLKLTFYLLYAQYGNSTITNADENQWQYRLFATIAMFGPTWSKKSEIQKALRDLDINAAMSASSIIYNHAYNPATTPTTQSTTELNYIDEQNVNKYKNGTLDTYTKWWEILNADITKEYINRFSGLFLKIVEPDGALLYEYDTEDNQ